MMETLCNWLAATSVSVAFQSWSWFVPTIQVIHILCVGILFMATLRVSVGLIAQRDGSHSATELWKRMKPAVWTALLVLLLTGTLLTLTEPARELLNWVFRTKMILVVLLAGLLSALPRLNVQQTAGRALGMLLLALGLALITAGRWIAYV
jgi:hypothetical protein